jgi:hypothetical protein
MLLSKIQLTIAAAAALGIGGLVLYARDADRALLRVKIRSAELQTAIGRLKDTVKRHDQQRAEDQRRLAALGEREHAIRRAYEEKRQQLDRLLAGMARRAKDDPGGLAAELARRLHDVLQRTGEAPRDRGAHPADPAAPSQPPGPLPRP